MKEASLSVISQLSLDKLKFENKYIMRLWLGCGGILKKIVVVGRWGNSAKIPVVSMCFPTKIRQPCKPFIEFIDLGVSIPEREKYHTNGINIPF